MWHRLRGAIWCYRICWRFWRKLRQRRNGAGPAACSPQHIEGVLSRLLHRYAERFPKVEVRIAGGTGSEILRLLESGENSPGPELAPRCEVRSAAFRQRSD